MCAGACSLVLDTSAEQCKVDGDCTARGAAFAGMKCVDRVCVGASDAGPDVDASSDTGADVNTGPWGCLGHVTYPAPTKPQVAVTVPLIDAISKNPRTDVLARVCTKLDGNCNTPLFPPTTPDANGMLHLTLAAGYDGFVLLTPLLPDGGTPPDAGDAGPNGQLVIPSLVFFNPPLFQDTTYLTILLLTQDELTQTAAIAGASPPDPSLGNVFMATYDCTGQNAAGVSVALDSTSSTTQGFYFLGSIPTLTTSATGYAGFINVPIGGRTVTGTLQATQQYIGKTTVFSRASMISYTVVAPSP